MILKQDQNTPVLAPQFSDMNAALTAYRTFSGREVCTMLNFVNFITQPSAQRDEFLEAFTTTITESMGTMKVFYN